MSTLGVLNDVEVARLAELEEVVERGQQTFVEVGLALAEIRENLLYRATYSTFEAYCQDRWGWTSSRARQLIAASKTVTSVTAQGLPAPKTEGEARRIAKAERDAEKERHAFVAELNAVGMPSIELNGGVALGDPAILNGLAAGDLVVGPRLRPSVPDADDVIVVPDEDVEIVSEDAPSFVHTWERVGRELLPAMIDFEFAVKEAHEAGLAEDDRRKVLASVKALNAPLLRVAKMLKGHPG